MEDVAGKYAGVKFETSADGRITFKTKQATGADKKTNDVKVPEHVVAVEDAVKRHHADLRKVFKHFCAAFPETERSSPYRLSRHGWHEVLVAFLVVDRRRLCATRR